MNELFQQLLDYARAMWHRRWFGLASMWLAAIVGVAFVYRIPERYEASARVYVDTETVLQPLLAGLAIQPNMDQQVALMSRTLISRPNVEKLIRMADLDLNITSNSAREALTDGVMRTIRLDGNTATNLYVISYRDPNPERAKKVVQSLLAIFVESSLGDKRQDSRSAVKFLDEQIKRYEGSLAAAETRLKEFKLKYMGVTGGNYDYFGRMSQIQGAIESARLELQAAEQSRDAYKRELAGETPTFLPEAPNADIQESVPDIDARIAALKREQDELLRKYTDKHPDVLATGRLINQLEEQRKDELEARRKAGGASGRAAAPPERNPMFQQLRLSLAEAEARVASSRAKLAAYENQYRMLLAQAQRVPQVEEEYTQLNREYDVTKTTYQNLLARREAGTMGIDVQDAGGAQFRVIDPPRVSQEPVAPNRPGMIGIAFAASALVGLVVTFLVSQIMPIFHDARALRQVSARPILGMVSMIPSNELSRFRRRRAYLFAGGLGAWVAAFVGISAFALLFGRAG